MTVEILTDADIELLITVPKRVENPGAKEREVGKHIQKDYRLVSDDGKHEFALFLRQSKLLPSSFSAGLRWLAKNGDAVILVRFNGSDHPHRNKLEGERFEFECHVHQATERYIAAGMKVESYAAPTQKYRTLNGALHSLVERCNISGLKTQPEERDLFE